MGLTKKMFGAEDAPTARNTVRATPAAAQPGDPVTATGHPGEVMEADHRLFEAALATLESAGFIPRHEPSLADVAQKGNSVLLRWLRARPLTVLLSLRDVDDEQFFDHVWVDPVEYTRLSAGELVELVHDVAAATGREDELGGVRVIFDPGTECSGSLSYRIGQDVADVSFDMDPEFGDENAEARIARDLAPGGTVPHLLFDRASARCTVVWAPADHESFFDALDAENQTVVEEF